MTSPLRIVFVAPFGLAHKTTVWARSLPLARELRRLGHDASIVVPPWDSPDDAGKIMTLDDVPVHNVLVGGGLPAVSLRLLRHIAQSAPDIVHVVKPRAYAGIVQWVSWQRRRTRAQRVPGPALILDIDDWEQPWAAINGYPWHVARFLAWQEEWGIRHADAITAASRWLAERAAQASPSIPVEYLPNGVDPGAGPNRHEAPAGPPRVLWFTRFVETSPEWMAACWKAVQREIPEAALVIAGSALQPGREAAFFHALESLRTERLGYVERERIPALLDTVTCAVFPSEETPLLQAKCSVRLATVLQHGVPVVASAVGEQAAYGGEGAALLVAADAGPEEFARRVVELVRSPAQQSALRSVSRRRMAEQYAWTHLAARLDQLYEDVRSHAR